MHSRGRHDWRIYWPWLWHQKTRRNDVMRLPNSHKCESDCSVTSCRCHFWPKPCSWKPLSYPFGLKTQFAVNILTFDTFPNETRVADHKWTALLIKIKILKLFENFSFHNALLRLGDLCNSFSRLLFTRRHYEIVKLNVKVPKQKKICKFFWFRKTMLPDKGIVRWLRHKEWFGLGAALMVWTCFGKQ